MVRLIDDGDGQLYGPASAASSSAAVNLAFNQTVEGSIPSGLTIALRTRNFMKAPRPITSSPLAASEKDWSSVSLLRHPARSA